MNIAQALKQKNRIVGEMNEIWKQIVKNNSYRTNDADEPNPNHDLVNKKIGEYNQLRQKLVELKAAIQKASAPIAFQLVSLSELKSQINLLDQIPTPLEKTFDMGRFDGKTTVSYYKNALDGAYVIATKKAFQNEINRLQDEVDTFNATTQI